MVFKTIEEEQEKIDFAKMAAAAFSKDENMKTFTIGDIIPGCFFAVRWGLLDDCVLVFRLGEDNPTIYTQSIIDERKK